jgi:1,4-dihydroxy-2-naphthoate polyprenyltransferase
LTFELLDTDGTMKLYLCVKTLWKLSRVPFLSVGILPMILGFALAWRNGYKGSPGLYLLSLLAVIFIMWMTYYLGEWNDLEGDRINRGYNQFSGGSRVIVDGDLPAWVPLFLGYVCLAAAVVLGVYIFLHYETGPWTLLLEGIGILAGFYYSNGPFRWSYRGVGEILIGFCYGWLPIATGFYLSAGYLNHQVLLLSIPVGLSIFNVILINEFPDEEADRAVGKRHLLVRHGKERMADLYVGLSVFVGLSFIKVISLIGGESLWLFILSGIPLALIFWNSVWMWQRNYGNTARLQVLCRNTLFINLSVTMILTLQQTLNFPA